MYVDESISLKNKLNHQRLMIYTTELSVLYTVEGGGSGERNTKPYNILLIRTLTYRARNIFAYCFLDNGNIRRG